MDRSMAQTQPICSLWSPGDLIAHPGQFTTMSGRTVELNLWVRPGDEGKCAFGMER